MPQDVNVLLQQALEALQQQRLDEAQTLFGEVLQQIPDEPTALHCLGVIASYRNDFQRAIELIEKSLTLQPCAEFHHNLGSVYSIIGRLADSRAQYEIAIRLNPDYAEAYFNWSHKQKFEPGSFDIAVLQRILDKSDLSEKDRAFASFAAAKILDDMGCYDDAFPHFEQANRAMHAVFDMQQYHGYVEQLVAEFDVEHLSTPVAGAPHSELPVFVVGMPRSGTTLVEQTLRRANMALAPGGFADPALNSSANG